MASYTTKGKVATGSTVTRKLTNSQKMFDVNAVNIGSIATVATPTSGKTLRLMGGYIGLSGNASVLFEDNAAGTTVFRTPLIATNTPFYFDLGEGKVLSAADNVLKATSSGAANITGTLFCVEE